MWMSSVPLTASIAPAWKTPDLSATWRYRRRFLGFGVSGLVRSWYLVLRAMIAFVPSPMASRNAASNELRFPM